MYPDNQSEKPFEIHYSEPSEELDLLGLASIFKYGFSIDWILGLTGIRASIALRFMDQAVDKKVLHKSDSGVFYFLNEGCRKQLFATLSPQQVENCTRRVLPLYMEESPGDKRLTAQVVNHLLEMKKDIAGYEWLFKAGLFYKKEFKRIEAQTCFSNIIEGLRSLQGDTVDRIFIKAAIEFSKSVDISEQAPSAYPVLKDALDRAGKLKDEVSIATIEMHLSSVQWFRKKHKDAYRRYKHACTLAAGITGKLWQRSFAVYKIIQSFIWGRYKEAVADYGKTAPDVARLPRYWFMLRGGYFLGTCMAATGEITQGLGLVHAIRERCRKMGNLSIATEAGIQLINVLISIRQIDKAFGYMKESMEDAESLNNKFLISTLISQKAYLHFLKNEPEDAARCLEQFRQMKDRGTLSVLPSQPYELIMGWAMLRNKMPKVKGFEFQELLQMYLKSLNKDIRGVALRYQAFSYIREGRSFNDVLAVLEESLTCLKASGSIIQTARTRIEIARQYSAVGKHAEFEEVCALFKRDLSGIDPDLVPSDLCRICKQPRGDKSTLRQILRLSREIASIRDYKELVHQVLSSANQITGAERGGIFLKDNGNGNGGLRLKASKTLTDQDVTDPGFGRSMELINQTYESGTGCVKVFRSGPENGPLQPSHIQSCICIPMVIRDKVVGVMYHDNFLLPTNFKASGLEILSHFASQAAIAIDYAKAYEEVRRLNQSLKKEKDYYKEKDIGNIHFDEIVGKSRGIMEVLSAVKQVANTDSTVLILGETGVGKELVARAIHGQSLRNKSAFISTHCTALPESLISSELFGHEKGAFTGATEQRIGRFELANKGTLFLDEIGELPSKIQIHLLRVLQTYEFERVGGTETIRSDFRLVLATNRDLEKEVRARRFRQDLYYRINVFPIKIPPLRERKEDIPLLASYFLGLYAKRQGKPVTKILNSDMDRLVAYDWPGNVRELENVIERGMILSNKQELVVPELSSQALSFFQGAGKNEKLPTLKDSEHDLIAAALGKTGGKISGKDGAADLLAINPHTLKSRMRKMGIKRDQFVTSKTKGKRIT